MKKMIVCIIAVVMITVCATPRKSEAAFWFIPFIPWVIGVVGSGSGATATTITVGTIVTTGGVVARETLKASARKAARTVVRPKAVKKSGGRTDSNGWHTTGGKGSGNTPHWHPPKGGPSSPQAGPYQ